MELNFLILGCIFILVLFGVGDSILKYLHLNRIFVLLSLTLIISGLFAPNLNLHEYSISFGYMLFPFIVSLYFILKLRIPNRFFIALLISTLLALCYEIVCVDEVVEMTYIPAIVLGAFNSIVLIIMTPNFASAFLTSFYGINLGSILYGITKYDTLNLAGNQYIFTSILISILSYGMFSFVLNKLGYYSKNKFTKENTFSSQLPTQ